MRISDWSSDVCSSDLVPRADGDGIAVAQWCGDFQIQHDLRIVMLDRVACARRLTGIRAIQVAARHHVDGAEILLQRQVAAPFWRIVLEVVDRDLVERDARDVDPRSEASRVGNECVSTGRYRGSP